MMRPGGLTQAGTGNTTLTGANTFTGATNITAGTLTVGATGALPSGTVATVASGATLNLGGKNQSLASLAGAGSVTFGVGTLTVGSANSATTFSGVMSGTGGLTKTGTGVFTVSGANTFTGATNVNAGTLKAGAANSLPSGSAVTVATGAVLDLGGFNQTIGSLAGAGNVTLGAGTLTEGGDNSSTTYSGVLSGTGGLTKNGTGATTLTGVDTYSGATTINAGTLIVNGSIANSTIALAGGTLKCSGNTGTLTVASGATVAPGNSIGTLNVSAINFVPGSVYQVETNAAGQTDLISATGKATITGGTVQALPAAGTYANQTTYTIINAAGGVVGTFTGVTSSLSTLDPSLAYTGTQVLLRLTRNDINFGLLGLTDNEKEAGAAVTLGGSHSALYLGLVGATDVPHGLDKLTGEIHSSVGSVLLEDGQIIRQTLFNRLRQATNAGNGKVAALADGIPIKAAQGADGSYTGWFQATKDWGSIQGDSNGAAVGHDLAGFTMGVDGYAAPNLQVGVAVGHSRSSTSIADRNSSATRGSFHAAAYGGYTQDNLSLRFGGDSSWGDVKTVRNVHVSTISDRDTSKHGARVSQAFAEAGYAVSLGEFALEPFANLSWVRATTSAFSESGGAAALDVAKDSRTVKYSTLGLNLANESDWDRTPVTFRGSLGWQHAFGGGIDPTQHVAFQATGNDFMVTGAPLDHSSAVMQLGMDFHLTPQASLGVNYQGSRSNSASNDAVQANFAWKF